MALFCPAIWCNSLSLLIFPLLNHVQVISCAFLTVFFCLKYPYCCLSSHFFSKPYCFSACSSVDIVVTGFSNKSFLLFRVSHDSLNCFIYALLKTSPLPPPFLDCILIVYIRLSHSFSFLAYKFYIIHLHKVVYLFQRLWICNLLRI